MPDSEFIKPPSPDGHPGGWEMVRLMWLVQHAIFASSGEGLQTLGLNPKSLAVLAIIEMLPHPHDIAVSLGAPDPTISNILKELEKQGYVERALAKGDRRRTMVVRTEKGDTACGEAIQLVDLQSSSVFETLTQPELAELSRILIKLSRVHEK